MTTQNYLTRKVVSTIFFFLTFAPLVASNRHNQKDDLSTTKTTTPKPQLIKKYTKTIIGTMIGACIMAGIGAIILLKSKQKQDQQKRALNPVKTNTFTNDTKHDSSDSEQNSARRENLSRNENEQLNASHIDHQNKRVLNLTETDSILINDKNEHHDNQNLSPVKPDNGTNDQESKSEQNRPHHNQKRKTVQPGTPKNPQTSENKQQQYPNKKELNIEAGDNNPEEKNDPSSFSLPPPTIWKEKEYLFSLPAIKSMGARVHNKIMHYLKQEDSTRIYKLIYTNLSNDKNIRKKKLKQLNKQIAKDEYRNLQTLCAEMIHHKPEEIDDSLLNYWIREKKEDEYFIKKTLQINLPTLPRIYQPIQGFDFTSSKKDKLRMDLMDDFDTSITVTKTSKNHYQVKIEQQKEEPFFDKLLMVPQGNSSLPFAVTKQHICYSPLNPGDYIVSSCKESPKESVEHENLLKIFYSNNASLPGSQQKPTNYSHLRILRILEMKSSQEAKDLFHLGIFLSKSQDSPIVAIIVKKNNKSITYWHDDLLEKMLACYQVKKLKTTNKTLDPASFKSSIKVISKGTDDLINTQNSKKVNALEGRLLDHLLNQKDYSSYLIDIFIEKGAITLQNIQNSHQGQIVTLNQKIKDILHLYHHQLSQKEVTESSILSTIVEKMLIRTITPNASVASNQALLEKLQTVDKHLKKIKSKPIFMLLGKTGAGKSTTASYLIGEKLIESSNEVGEKIIKKKRERKATPTIGHEISSAQTLYFRGFQVNKKDRSQFPTLIVDSPGLDNTGSSDDQLVPNMSLDQAIFQSGPLKALVLVIPLRSFLNDRGNPAFNLIQLMQRKFPHVFKLNAPDFKYVHILVTKHTQLDKNVVNAFRKGVRFTKVLIDLHEQEKKVINDKNKSDHEHQKKLSDIQEKKEIWQLIETLKEKKRFDLMDIKNDINRERLLKQYGNIDGSINKDQYQTALTPSQIDQLSTLLKKSFFTWQDIFKEYDTLIDQVKKLDQQEQNSKTKDLNKTQSTLKEAKQKKRKYAFIITKKQDEPQFLISLAANLFDHPKWKQQSKVDKKMTDSLEGVYKKFSQYYNQHANGLHSQAEKDLAGTETLKQIKAKAQNSEIIDDDPSDTSASDQDSSDSESTTTDESLSESDSDSESSQQTNDTTLESFLVDHKLGDLFEKINQSRNFNNQLQPFLSLNQEEVVELCKKLKIRSKKKNKLLKAWSSGTLKNFLMFHDLGLFFDKINKLGKLENNLESFFNLDKNQVKKIGIQSGIKVGKRKKLLRVWSSGTLKNFLMFYDLGHLFDKINNEGCFENNLQNFLKDYSKNDVIGLCNATKLNNKEKTNLLKAYEDGKSLLSNKKIK